jgi:RHS repeat-associated protein
VAMRVGTSTVYYLLVDHLGSTSLTANSSGSRVAEVHYKAWGEDLWTYGTTPTTYRYTGQRVEAGVGLYYYGARWYDAALSRFVQADTVVPNPGDPQSFGKYSYARNNPLRYLDPTGHQEEQTEPPAGVSQEEHERLLRLQAEALQLLERVGVGEITDVEALAFLLEFAITLGTSEGSVNWDRIFSDLGIVVGGIRTGFLGWPIYTHGGDDLYSGYYVPGFGATGFREDYRSNIAFNQVRHFVGGLWGGSSVFSQWYQRAQEQEADDRRLYDQAYSLRNDIARIHEEEGVGNWIIRNLATEEVQERYSASPPSNCPTCLLPRSSSGAWHRPGR